MREKMYSIIFESDTKLGKIFDIVLLWFILLSVLIVCLESIESLNLEYGKVFFILEWVLTLSLIHI